MIRPIMTMPFFLFGFISTSAFADRPDRALMGIDSLTYSGPSCPPGSGAANISEDGEAFTILFDQFTVDGSASPSLVANGRCQLQIRVRTPRGWTYGVQTLDFRAFVQLPDASVSLTQSTQVSLGGGFRDISNWTINGPIVDDIVYRLPQSGETIWASCNGNAPLRVVSQARIRGAGLLTVDSIDGVIALSMPLFWKRCQ